MLTRSDASEESIFSGSPLFANRISYPTFLNSLFRLLYSIFDKIASSLGVHLNLHLLVLYASNLRRQFWHDQNNQNVNLGLDPNRLIL